MRWRWCSRHTMIGARTRNVRLLCSNGVPCRLRMRNPMRPRTRSSLGDPAPPVLTQAAWAMAMSSPDPTRPKDVPPRHPLGSRRVHVTA
jgi:hypothetical protein